MATQSYRGLLVLCCLSSCGGALATPAPLACRIHEAAKAHKAVEQELAHAVNTSSLALGEALSSKATGTSEVS